MHLVAKRRFALIASVLLAAMLIVGLINVGPAEAGARRARRVEKRLVNHERKPRERRAVRLNLRLSRIAQRHSRKMARRDRLYHNSSLASQVDNMAWRTLGENVGVGPSFDGIRPSLRVLHDAFMASTPHRKNILNRPFRKVGVGVASKDGKTWVTVVFMG